MNHPLQQRIGDVRHHARRIVWQSAFLRFGIAVLTTLLVAGLMDYGLRIHDRGLQMMLSFLVTASVIVAAAWYFRPAFRYRLPDVTIARQIEMRHPELDGSLSSGVEFLTLEADDRRAGSETLRCEVIQQAASDTELIDFASVVDSTVPQWLKWTLLGLIGIVLILLCMAPSRWTLAARRLLSPLGSPDWPRRHVLEFESVPPTIAVGSDLDLAVIDRNGRLPGKVQLVYEFANPPGDDHRMTTVQELVLRDGRMVGMIEKVTRSMKYRAVGGDDDQMPWQELTVIEPPRIRELQIALHPPEYTGWPVEISEGAIRALMGTQITVEGRSDRKIVSATVNVRTPEAERKIAAAVGEDGFEFHLAAGLSPPWVVRQSGCFSIAVRDRRQMEDPDADTWDIRAVADLPPNVEWQRPRNGAAIVRDAIVSLQLTVNDDLAVRSVVAEYRRSDRLESGWLPCQSWDLSQRPPAERFHPQGQGESHLVRWQWNVADLDALAPDVVLEVRAVAKDFLPQSNISSVRRLQVVTRSQLRIGLENRQTELLLGMSELLTEQQSAYSRTAQMVTQLQSPSGRPLSVTGLRNLESAQRRIRQRLVTDEESLLEMSRQLSDEFSENQLDAGVAHKIRKLTEELERLDSMSLPEAEEQLFAASQWAADPKSPHESIVRSLQSAQRHQIDISKSLQSTVGEMTAWEVRQRIARELEGIIARQERIKVDTQRLWRTTVTGSRRTEDVPALVDRLSRRQQELTRYLERLAARMAAVRQEIASTDTVMAESESEAETVARAAEVGHDLQVASHMQRSVERFREQRLAESSAQQQQAVVGLRAMRQALLRGQRETLSLRDGPSQIRELKRRVQEMTEQQQPLADETGQALFQADVPTLLLIRKIQADIRQRTEQLSDGQRGDRSFSDSERQEWDQLSRDQGDLARLVSQLIGNGP